jgi:hypothetical protein
MGAEQAEREADLHVDYCHRHGAAREAVESTMTAWVRIQRGELTDREWDTLQQVANRQPVIPRDLRTYDNAVWWWTLRDLAVAGLVELRNTVDGDVKNPHDIERAWFGGWLGVTLRLTAAGEACRGVA